MPFPPPGPAGGGRGGVGGGLERERQREQLMDRHAEGLGLYGSLIVWISSILALHRSEDCNNCPRLGRVLIQRLETILPHHRKDSGL